MSLRDLLDPTFGELAKFRGRTTSAEFGDSPGHPFRGNQWQDGIMEAPDTGGGGGGGSVDRVSTVRGMPEKEYNTHYNRGWTSSMRSQGDMEGPESRYAGKHGNGPKLEAWNDGWMDAAVGREKYASREVDGYTDSEGKHWSPVSKYGLDYDPANSDKPEVKAANAFKGWDELPTTDFRLSEHKLHAQEEHVKDSSVEKVVSGRVALREGYDPHILIDSKGEAYVIDGHHRVAMYGGLKRDVMPSKVYDVRERGKIELTASFLATLHPAEQARLLNAEFGDLPGHDFRGNQWTAGTGDRKSEAAAVAITNAMKDAAGFWTRDDGSRPDLAGAGLMDRGRVKAANADMNGRRMAALADERPGVAVWMDEKLAEKMRPDIATDNWTREDELLAEAQYNLDHGNPVGWLDTVGWDYEKSSGDRIRELADAARANPDVPDPRALIGMDYARSTIGVWQQTAADSDNVAWALQRAVQDELGVESRQWDRISAPKNWTDSHPYSREGEMMRAYVRAEYDNTQDMLRKAGIGPDDPVHLYRGMSFEDSWVEAGDTAPVDLNPASSWTTDIAVADQFSHIGSGDVSITMSTSVPAKDIIGSAITGRGALIESEVLVRNRNQHVLAVKVSR